MKVSKPLRHPEVLQHVTSDGRTKCLLDNLRPHVASLLLVEKLHRQGSSICGTELSQESLLKNPSAGIDRLDAPCFCPPCPGPLPAPSWLSLGLSFILIR